MRWRQKHKGSSLNEADLADSHKRKHQIKTPREWEKNTVDDAENGISDENSPECLSKKREKTISDENAEKEDDTEDKMESKNYQHSGGGEAHNTNGSDKNIIGKHFNQREGKKQNETISALVKTPKSYIIQAILMKKM